MNVESVRELKAEAEQEISKLLYYLTKDTDCYLSDVSIDIIDTTVMGEEPSTALGKVSTSLRI